MKDLIKLLVPNPNEPHNLTVTIRKNDNTKIVRNMFSERTWHETIYKNDKKVSWESWAGISCTYEYSTDNPHFCERIVWSDGRIDDLTIPEDEELNDEPWLADHEPTQTYEEIYDDLLKHMGDDVDSVNIKLGL